MKKNHLCFLLVVFSLLFALPCFASASTITDAGYCGEGYLYHGVPLGGGKNLTWTLDDNGILTVSGDGKMCDYAGNVSFEGYTYYNLLTSSDDNKAVNKIVINDGVTSIGEAAFGNYNAPYTNLRSVIIPNSVKEIGKGAFGYCSGLNAVSIPTSVKIIGDNAFVGCSNLTDIDVPNSVTEFGWGIFEGCSGLKRVSLPGRITTIARDTFLECSSLESIIIPEKVTSIGAFAFKNCENLKHIEIPCGVTTIDSEAFVGCSSLTEINIPNSVTTLGSHVFADCSSLKKLVIPESVTKYEGLSFIGCESLASITIPKSITSISYDAFDDCEALKDIYYGGSVVEWMNMTRNITVPSSVTVHYDSKGPIVAGFIDVLCSDYYADAVQWAVDNNVTKGTSATTFSPQSTVTRGQTVTFLWRAMGQPEPTNINNPFIDVRSSDYFYKAVLWAVEKEITKGTSATSFSPNSNVTRAQTITFLWRTEGQPNATGVGTWYEDAERWANNSNLLNGTAKAYSPNADCPRADIVTYLYRDLSQSKTVNSGNETQYLAYDLENMFVGTWIVYQHEMLNDNQIMEVFPAGYDAIGFDEKYVLNSNNTGYILYDFHTDESVMASFNWKIRSLKSGWVTLEYYDETGSMYSSQTVEVIDEKTIVFRENGEYYDQYLKKA